MIRPFISTLLAFISTALLACNSAPVENDNSNSTELNKQIPGQKVAYFASGCFWCVEAIFQSVQGVSDAVSGYSGGDEPNPTYKEVSSGRTSHAEAVAVYYDPDKVSFETLVKVFFGSHDPTTLNQQGPDRGAQYRSIAFYQNEDEKRIIEEYIAKLEKEGVYDDPIVTEVSKFVKFYKAEEYHQEYERLHPENPYVQSVSIPRLKKFQAKFPELLKQGH
ncbi:MAG: peptide-methionine (S)-S-oxide reductase [Flavobacteriales bacterium]|nr:peptide-methionine (S)-S-oxide reductase [Flavobacteriales bacterium]